MIYNLYVAYKDFLAAHGMGFFRVFDYATFRAVIAIILSFLIVVCFARKNIS